MIYTEFDQGLASLREDKEREKDHLSILLNLEKKIHMWKNSNGFDEKVVW